MNASLPRRAASAAGRGRDRVRALPGGTLTVRIVVTTLGLAVIAVGIILLPLPGPGWLIIFAGMGILATEYAWAARLLQRARRYVGAWTRWVTRQPLPIRGLIALGFMAIVAGALWLSWWLVR